MSLFLFPRPRYAPVLTSLSSTTGARFSGAKSAQAATGSRFMPSSVVRIDGVDASTTYNSATSLTYAIAENVLWTAGAKSVTVYTPGAALSSAQTYTVTQHGNLKIELLPAGFVVAGSSVSGWLDSSGVGANSSFSQATGGNQPAYVASGINGLPAARGTSTSHYLDAPTACALRTFTNATHLRVLKPSVASVTDKGASSIRLDDGAGIIWALGGTTGLFTGETWIAAAYISLTNNRLAAAYTDFSWSANETFLETTKMPSTGGVVFAKNGTTVPLTLSSTGGSTVNYTPAATEYGATPTSRIHTSMSSNEACLIGAHLVFDAVLDASTLTQVQRFLGGLFSVTVP